MVINFKPIFTLTPSIINDLLRIQSIKERVIYFPVSPCVLASLRQSARLYTTHYSTMIEGNQLDPAQIKEVLEHKGHFPGRQRDEKEVKGYYAALHSVELWAAEKIIVSQLHIQKLHALVMADGKKKCKPTSYRDGQNVIRDSMSNLIIYMPPQADDVPMLMADMIDWLNDQKDMPAPIVAAIIHYQFATIHPYYDGNGRTARLLTTLILHLSGYDLKGLYCLEEYYGRNLQGYYDAISIGTSHNYYMGRVQADITPWIAYFIAGMAQSFENVIARMEKMKDQPDQSEQLKKIDPAQRKVLELFVQNKTITSKQVGVLFGCKARTSSQLCADWVNQGFLKIIDPSNKARTYALADEYETLI